MAKPTKTVDSRRYPVAPARPKPVTASQKAAPASTGKKVAKAAKLLAEPASETVVWNLKSWPAPVPDADDDDADPADKAIGFGVFFRGGVQLIEKTDRSGVPMSLGFDEAKPQVRLRSLRHTNEAPEVPEECRFTHAEYKAKPHQIRWLINAGAAVIISAGKYSVIADRHPLFSHDLIDGHIKYLRRSWQSLKQRKMYDDVAAMRQSMERTEASAKMVRTQYLQLDNRFTTLVEKLGELLKGVHEKTLSAEHITALNKLVRDAANQGLNANANPLLAGHLDKTSTKPNE